MNLALFEDNYHDHQAAHACTMHVRVSCQSVGRTVDGYQEKNAVLRKSRGEERGKTDVVACLNRLTIDLASHS